MRELPRYAKQRFGVSGWISSNLGTMDDKWTSNARFTHSGLPLEIPRPWLGGGSCGQPGKRWANPGGSPVCHPHLRGDLETRAVLYPNAPDVFTLPLLLLPWSVLPVRLATLELAQRARYTYTSFSGNELHFFAFSERPALFMPISQASLSETLLVCEGDTCLRRTVRTRCAKSELALANSPPTQ